MAVASVLGCHGDVVPMASKDYAISEEMPPTAVMSRRAAPMLG